MAKSAGERVRAIPCSILLADFNLFTQKKEGGMRSGKSDGGRGNKEKEREREGRVVNRDFDFGRGERGRKGRRRSYAQWRRN